MTEDVREVAGAKTTRLSACTLASRTSSWTLMGSFPKPIWWLLATFWTTRHEVWAMLAWPRTSRCYGSGPSWPSITTHSAWSAGVVARACLLMMITMICIEIPLYRHTVGIHMTVANKCCAIMSTMHTLIISRSCAIWSTRFRKQNRMRIYGHRMLCGPFYSLMVNDRETHWRWFPCEIEGP